MNLDQANQKGHVLMSTEKQRSNFAIAFDTHIARINARKMQILMAHSKRGREFFSTSGTGDPG